jgi:hypothetical protein
MEVLEMGEGVGIFFVIGEVLGVEMGCECWVWFKGTPGRGLERVVFGKLFLYFLGLGLESVWK